MRYFQRSPVARFGSAVLAGAILALAAGGAVPAPLAALLGATLTIVVFLTLTIAPDAIALQRGHHWRWWWRSSDDDGPFWPLTRIPRQPGPRP